LARLCTSRYGLPSSVEHDDVFDGKLAAAERMMASAIGRRPQPLLTRDVQRSFEVVDEVVGGVRGRSNRSFDDA
jgi:hypothetical protein